MPTPAQPALFPLVDRLRTSDLSVLGLRRNVATGLISNADGQGRHIQGVKTGEFRQPRAGDWFLSGSIPEGYLAPNDLATCYWILRPVSGQSVTTTTFVLDE